MHWVKTTSVGIINIRWCLICANYSKEDNKTLVCDLENFSLRRFEVTLFKTTNLQIMIYLLLCRDVRSVWLKTIWLQLVGLWLLWIRVSNLTLVFSLTLIHSALKSSEDRMYKIAWSRWCQSMFFTLQLNYYSFKIFLISVWPKSRSLLF